MKKLSILFLLLSLYATSMVAQNMTQKDLFKIMAQKSEVIEQTGNSWQIKFEGLTLITIVDETNNRMRIITPAAEEKKMKKDDLVKCLSANFDTALDVKYALFNEYLWSVFAHPLKELSEDQVVDAMYQVRNAAATYGTYYQSTNLTYGTQSE